MVRLGREKGIEVFVDGAHAFAHLPFRRDDLECDYFGCSLHKWLLAPIGTGFLYVRKSKIKSIWPLMGADPPLDEDIRKYEQIGTHPAANHNAIAAALAFHRSIGTDRKLARLRYLRDRWAKPLLARRSARQALDADRRRLRPPAASPWCRSRASTRASSSATSGTSTGSSPRPRSTRSSRASASLRMSTPRSTRSTVFVDAMKQALASGV